MFHTGLKVVLSSKNVMTMFCYGIRRFHVENVLFVTYNTDIIFYCNDLISMLYNVTFIHLKKYYFEMILVIF